MVKTLHGPLERKHTIIRLEYMICNWNNGPIFSNTLVGIYLYTLTYNMVDLENRLENLE